MTNVALPVVFGTIHLGLFIAGFRTFDILNVIQYVDLKPLFYSFQYLKINRRITSEIVSLDVYSFLLDCLSHIIMAYR